MEGLDSILKLSTEKFFDAFIKAVAHAFNVEIVFIQGQYRYVTHYSPTSGLSKVPPHERLICFIREIETDKFEVYQRLAYVDYAVSVVDEDN